MAELVGEMKQSGQAIDTQARNDKAQIEHDYAASKKAFRLARRQYLKSRSGFFHFVRFLRFLFRWLFRLAVLAALLLLAYVIVQKPLTKATTTDAGVPAASPVTKLHDTLGRVVSEAPEACRDYVEWVVWSDKEKALAAAQAEKQSAEARYEQTTNQIQQLTVQVAEMQTKLDEAAAELTKEQEATKTAQQELEQARTENGELKTAKDEADKKVTAKDAELQESIGKQTKLQKEIETLRKQKTVLLSAIRKLREQGGKKK
jgi:peptidoglycan hydrolase CwlO-like protein